MFVTQGVYSAKWSIASSLVNDTNLPEYKFAFFNALHYTNFTFLNIEYEQA